MSKIFVFSGSPRNDHSVCNAVIEEVIDRVKRHTEEKIEVDFFSQTNSKINYCQGCECCFLEGYCKLDEHDSMKQIKFSMLSADLVIIATPIYAGNVSAYTKMFIDRLSYWLHLMRLAGKKAYFINTSTGNGKEFVNQYFAAIACSLGLSVLGILNIIGNEKKHLAEEVNQRQIRLTVEGICKWLTHDIKDSLYRDGLNKVFTDLKKIYLRVENLDHAEVRYWKNNGMLECQSFDEMLKNIKEKGICMSNT